MKHKNPSHLTVIAGLSDLPIMSHHAPQQLSEDRGSKDRKKRKGDQYVEKNNTESEEKTAKHKNIKKKVRTEKRKGNGEDDEEERR